MKKILLFFVCFLFLFGFVFRDLLFHINTHLYDWGDGPYAIWVIFQNIQKIKTLDFLHFFDTNAFYPNKMTLLFSDILLPQSLIAVPFSFITQNPIFVFNLVFFITFILNYCGAFLLWNQLFKNSFLAFFGSLLIVFSPFFYLQLGHFQMLSYWPFLFSLYFVFKNEEARAIKYLIFAGIFLSIQFLASVYLAIFLLATLFIYYGISFFFSQKKQQVIISFIMIILVFLTLDGIFIKGYLDMKQIYQTKRSINEYITYSAHLSDYLFSNSIQTIIHKNPIVNKWNSINKHAIGESAAFPGFLISLLFVIGLFNFRKQKKFFECILKLDQVRFFFFLVLVVGFIFSLGPRLNFNGNYVHIPLPYAFVMKFFPFFESIRALARWSFLFYFGLIFFSLSFLQKIKIEKKPILLITVFVIFFLEYIPLSFQASQEAYLNNDYRILRDICSQKKQVLLEIPVTHLSFQGNIYSGLKYITKVELASLYHGCLLVNGYSGYDLPELQALEDRIKQSFEHNKMDDFVKNLKQNNVNIIKLNIKMPQLVYPDLVPLSLHLYRVR
jgi:hypothetical protein